MKRIISGLIITAAAIHAEDRPRVFITDSASWEVAGRSGGARPQTAEIFKTFGANCKQVIVTNARDRADYVVTLDHEGGKGLARRDNKFAVFNKEGDMVGSGSTRSLGGSVNDACKAIVGGR